MSTATMSQGTIAPPESETLADLVRRLGDIPLDRIRLRPAPGTATVEDVDRIEAKENRLFELVEGTLVEKAMGFESAWVALQLGTLINLYLDRTNLGVCVGADGMMQIAQGLVRIPDVSYVSWDRIPGGEVPKKPVPNLAPDLAVEILSPTNTPGEMNRMVGEFFEAGVRLVWLIDPEKRTARIHTAPGSFTEIDADGTLDGLDVLSGFSVRLGELLDRGRRRREG